MCGVHQKKTETLPNSMTLNTGIKEGREGGGGGVGEEMKK